MAQLFGKGTIKDHIIALDWFSQEKIEIIKRLYQDFQAWNLNDESRYEQTFNQLFFWELLGYEDRINRIPKWWVVGSWIADLTLWIFQDGSYTPEDVQVVCELKWAKTNLSKKQFWHGGLSPVGQGFAYKTGLKNCKWLVVSNFYEIRLYRDNQTDFEVWTLDELMDTKDDYFNLRKLYLLLHKNNLLSSVGTSKTEALLSHFREEQQTITKEFYKKYKELRLDLINDLKQRNQSASIELLIEKAQKIIDRLIFVFFCEDKGLLPDKKLKENIMRSQEAGFTPWEITKKFFHLVDRGSESLGVPHGYNGWLFKEDLELNALEVGDFICKKFVDLTNYDFDDELSVNVLGHIFEQSISDLENLKITLLGQEVETEQLADTGKWRRKKDGIFYTPEYIVDYIVQNSVMKYLNEKEDECLSEFSTIDEKIWERRRKKNIENPEQKAYLKYKNILQNIKVLDPACWSGAFLVRVFDVLLEENKRVWKILNTLFDEAETYKNILTNNIYGVDLNAESVEITKLSLRLKSAQKDKKLNNLDANIKCGNSLIDDVFVAGEKAFDWNVEFRDIMKNWGFDVIVGNPPYVRVQNLPHNHIDRYKWNKETAFKRVDISILFFELAYNVLKQWWVVSFITSNQFTTTEYWKNLRIFITNKFKINEIIDFGDLPIFEEALTYVSIFVFEKWIPQDFLYYKCNDLREAKEIGYKEKQIISLKTISDDVWVFANKNNKEILDKLSTFEKLEKYWNTWAGLITWLDDILMFDKEEAVKIWFEKDLLLPIIRWTDPERYNFAKSSKVVLYPYFYDWKETKLIDIEEIKQKYPVTYKYLNENKKKLELRKDSRHTFEWKHNRFWLVRFWQKIIFNQEKIVTPWEVKNHKFWLDVSWNWFSCARVFAITSNDKIKLRFLLCLLNSSLIKFYLQSFAPLKSWWYYTYSSWVLGKVPIKIIPLSDQQPFIEKADKMLSINKELHELIDKFFHRIQDNLKVEKITPKLEVFYEWEFKDFITELKKQKISLSLSDQDTREPYFKEYKDKILTLKNEIDKTDKEIDEMAFDLYGLNEEERKVVLDG